MSRAGVGLGTYARGAVSVRNEEPPDPGAVDPPTPVGSLSFTHVATSSDAASRATTWGKSLQGLIGFDGKVHGGYGDWDTNTGAVKLWEYDPASPSTITYTGVTASTEAVQIIRNLAGTLWLPAIDPTDNQARLYKRQAAGAWTEVLIGSYDAHHVFDVASFGGSLYACGSSASSTYQPATVWRSVDGGTTWTVSRRFDGTRCYWLMADSTHLWTSDQQGHWWKYDGTIWVRDDSTYTVPHRGYYSTSLTNVAVFTSDILALHSNNNQVVTIDGVAYSQMRCIGFGDTSDHMWMVSSSAIYKVDTTGIVAEWNHDLSPITVKPSGVCELGGYVYVGGADGKLYRAAI